MKAVKCPNCGANITLDESKDTGVCKFCDSVVISEKSTSPINNDSQYHSQNRFASNSIFSHNIADRPQINILIAIVLFCLSFFGGLVYILYIRHKQKEWDIQHMR